MGAAKDVPRHGTYSRSENGSAPAPAPRPLTPQTFWPGATTSGLMRPSAVGPRELKEEILPLTGCTAPTAMTPGASAGTVM